MLCTKLYVGYKNLEKYYNRGISGYNFCVISHVVTKVLVGIKHFRQVTYLSAVAL
jgi:hypothetical protein